MNHKLLLKSIRQDLTDVLYLGISQNSYGALVVPFASQAEVRGSEPGFTPRVFLESIYTYEMTFNIYQCSIKFRKSE